MDGAQERRRSSRIALQKEEKAAALREVTSGLETMGVSGEDKISWEEFCKVVKNPSFTEEQFNDSATKLLYLVYEQIKQSQEEKKQAQEQIKQAEERIKQAEERIKQAEEREKQAQEEKKLAEECHELLRVLGNMDRKDTSNIIANVTRICEILGLDRICEKIHLYHTEENYFAKKYVAGDDGKLTRMSTGTDEQSSRQSEERSSIDGDVNISNIKANVFNGTKYCPIIAEWYSAKDDIANYLVNSVFGSTEKLTEFIDSVKVTYDTIRATQLVMHGKLTGLSENERTFNERKKFKCTENEIKFTQPVYCAFLVELRKKLQHYCEVNARRVNLGAVSFGINSDTADRLRCTLRDYPNSSSSKIVTLTGCCDVLSKFDDSNSVLHEAKKAFSGGLNYFIKQHMQAMCYANAYFMSRKDVNPDETAVVRYVLCDLQSVAIAERYPAREHRDAFAGVHFISPRATDVELIIMFLMYSLVLNENGLIVEERIDNAVARAEGDGESKGDGYDESSGYGDDEPGGGGDGEFRGDDDKESGDDGDGNSRGGGGNDKSKGGDGDNERRGDGDGKLFAKQCGNTSGCLRTVWCELIIVLGHTYWDALSRWSDISDARYVAYNSDDEEQLDFALKMNEMLQGSGYLSEKNLMRCEEVDIAQRWLEASHEQKLLWEYHEDITSKTLHHFKDEEDNNENVHPNMRLRVEA